MNIWVDADACPVQVKELIFRAAERKEIQTTFVANQTIRVPKSLYIQFIQVPKGFDVADNEISNRVSPGDLVVTQDIPLAAEVIEKDCIAISTRGDLYTKANIKARLTMRNFMEELRSSGVQTGGPPALNAKDIKVFADCFDRLLSQKMS